MMFGLGQYKVMKKNIIDVINVDGQTMTIDELVSLYKLYKENYSLLKRNYDLLKMTYGEAIKDVKELVDEGKAKDNKDNEKEKTKQPANEDKVSPKQGVERVSETAKGKTKSRSSNRKATNKNGELPS